MTLTRRAILILSLVTVVLRGWSGALIEDDDQKQLRVTIIAITHFDDNQLANPALINAITDVSQQLDTFFSSNYGIHPRIFTTRDETTAEALRHWLFYDLPRDSQKSINLVFILTHGIGYQYSGSTLFKNELFLATADTQSDNYFGIAIRGSELIDSFERLTRGSSVFLFLDTCGSGSIDNSGIEQLLSLDKHTATRMMILAGSMPDESAYRARFTKALLKIWQTSSGQGVCHKVKDIESYVQSTMNIIDPLAQPLTQDISLVLPYTTDFCIESFASQGALALVANPTDEDVRFVLTLVGDNKDIITDRIKPHDVKPVVLRRSQYSITVDPVYQTSTLKHDSGVIDLRSEYVQYRVLYAPDLIENAALKQKAASFANEWGASHTFVRGLLESAQQELQQALTTKKDEVEQLKILESHQADVVQDAVKQQAVVDAQAQQAALALAQAKAEIQSHPEVHVYSAVGAEMSRPENRALDTAQAASERLETSAESSRQKRREEEERLAAIVASKKKTTAQVTVYETLLKQMSANTHADIERAKSRQALLDAMKDIFPTADTSRGLVASVPLNASSTDLDRLGKIVSSLGPRALIEIEVYLAQPAKSAHENQVAAQDKAEVLRAQMVQHAGMLPESIVTRGFAGMSNAVNEAGSVQIIVSGEEIAY